MGRFLLLLNLAYLLLVNFLVKHGREILLVVAAVLCVLGLMFLPAIGHAAESGVTQSGSVKALCFVAVFCGGTLIGLIGITLIVEAFGEIGVVCIAVVMLILGIAFWPSDAKADDTAVDVFQCSKIAAAYSKNPFALQMKELDDLRLCITWQMSQIQREARDAKEARAIERNFGAGRDGE